MSPLKSALKKLYRAVPFKSYLFSLLRYFYIPSQNVYKHLHFVGPFSVQVEGRPLKLMHYGYQIENGVFWEGLPAGFEQVSMKLWLDSCKFSSTIIDVGANTGIYALAAKAAAPESTVIAFEPIERVFEKLEFARNLNGMNILCEKSALSNSTGSAIIFDPLTEHTYSVTVNKNLADRNIEVREVQIKTIRLDEYWENTGKGRKIDLMKIDVETHEKEVLEGMGKLVELHKPAILIELLNDEVALGVEKILAPHGYLFFNIDEKSRPQAVAQLGRSSFRNFFVCQPELAAKLQLL